MPNTNPIMLITIITLLTLLVNPTLILHNIMIRNRGMFGGMCYSQDSSLVCADGTEYAFVLEIVELKTLILVSPLGGLAKLDLEASVSYSTPGDILYERKRSKIQIAACYSFVKKLRSGSSGAKQDSIVAMVDALPTLSKKIDDALFISVQTARVKDYVIVLQKRNQGVIIDSKEYTVLLLLADASATSDNSIPVAQHLVVMSEDLSVYKVDPDTVDRVVLVSSIGVSNRRKMNKAGRETIVKLLKMADWDEVLRKTPGVVITANNTSELGDEDDGGMTESSDTNPPSQSSSRTRLHLRSRRETKAPTRLTYADSASRKRKTPQCDIESPSSMPPAPPVKKKKADKKKGGDTSKEGNRKKGWNGKQAGKNTGSRGHSVQHACNEDTTKFISGWLGLRV